MARTNVDIDEDLIRRVIEHHGFKTKREAIDFALRQLVPEPMSIEEALAMQGTGWDGDLDELRGTEDPEIV